MTEKLRYIDIDPDGAKQLAQRLHLKKDDIELIRKSYASEKQAVDEKERSVIAYISTDTRDRDGEILMPGGVVLDNYRQNPVVLWSHQYNSVPIGKNLWIKQDKKGLIAKTVFAKSEFADEVYRAYTEDIDGTGPLMKSWSVGFIPIEYEDVKIKGTEGKTRVYKKWEILEYSAVAVPSCPDALSQLAAKGLIPNGLKKYFDIEIQPDEPADRDIEIEVNPDPFGTSPEQIKAAVSDVIRESGFLSPEIWEAVSAQLEGREPPKINLDINEIVKMTLARLRTNIEKSEVSERARENVEDTEKELEEAREERRAEMRKILARKYPGDRFDNMLLDRLGEKLFGSVKTKSDKRLEDIEEQTEKVINTFAVPEIQKAMKNIEPKAIIERVTTEKIAFQKGRMTEE